MFVCIVDSVEGEVLFRLFLISRRSANSGLKLAMTGQLKLYSFANVKITQRRGKTVYKPKKECGSSLEKENHFAQLDEVSTNTKTRCHQSRHATLSPALHNPVDPCLTANHTAQLPRAS